MRVEVPSGAEISDLVEMPHCVIGTINLKYGKALRIHNAARHLKRMNVDLAILTETKVVRKQFPKRADDYRVYATEAKSAHQGGGSIGLSEKIFQIFSGRCQRVWAECDQGSVKVGTEIVDPYRGLHSS